MKILTVYEDEAFNNPIVFARRIDKGDEDANIEKGVNDFLAAENVTPENIRKEDIISELCRAVNPYCWMNEHYCFSIVTVKDE